MKVLLVSNEFALGPGFDGGLGQALLRIALGLKDLGHEIIVLRTGEKRERKFNSGIEIITVPVVAPPWTRWLNALTLKQFDLARAFLLQIRALSREVEKIVLERPPDIVQYPNLGGLGLFRPRDIPSVIRMSSDTRSWRLFGGRDNQSRFAMSQMEFLEIRALRRADALYGPSETIARIVENRCKNPVRVIRPPVFLETTSLDNSLLRERIGSEPFLLFVGRLNRLKGILVLAEILEEFLARHPEHRIVVIGREQAGFNGEPMGDHLRRQAGRHQDRLILLDPVPHSMLYPVISAAEAVILPSLIDNLPNTMLEAMLHHKIVITTRGSGADELIEDGISGFLCERDNPHSLLTAIESFFRLEAEQRKDMGERAFESLRELRPKKTIPELLEFYRDVRRKFKRKRS